MAAIRIGHACIDENGKSQRGLAGDQTGKEVCTRSYYNHKKGWVVLRATNKNVAEKIAKCMEDACANKYIGYDQSSRHTLYNAVKNNGFKCDIKSLKKAVETDCSALVRVCVNYAGVSVGDFTTLNEKSVLTSTGKFKLISWNGDKNSLKRGDILVTKTKGHTAVVISDALEVDGYWGVETTEKLQRVFKNLGYAITIDGKVSNQWAIYKEKNLGLLSSTFEWHREPNGKGSQLIKAMQKWAGMPSEQCDGEIGAQTIKVFQKKFGTVQDGVVSAPSNMVKALQKWANAQD